MNAWEEKLHTQVRESLRRFREASKLYKQADELMKASRDLAEGPKETIEKTAGEIFDQAEALLIDGPVYVERTSDSMWGRYAPGIMTEEEFREMSLHSLIQWWSLNEDELSTNICNASAEKFWPMTPEEVEKKLTPQETGLHLTYHYQYCEVLKKAPAEQRILAKVLSEKLAGYAKGNEPDWRRWS
jgi:hypothetical protein